MIATILLLLVFIGYVLWSQDKRLSKLEAAIAPQSAPQKERVSESRADDAPSPPVWARQSADETPAPIFEKQEEAPAAPAWAQPVATETQPKTSIDQRIGSSLFVWLGGVALIFAGIFMVKYSIDNNLISPSTRIFFGLLFGAGLLFAGSFFSNRQNDIANANRIGLSLTGSGIAVLYGSVLGASSAYHLIGPGAAFIGMAAITVLAIVKSLKDGMPVALLGLAGGFLTPAFIGSNEPNAVGLFSYLALLLGGIVFVSHRKAWWGVGAMATIASLLWAFFWIVGGPFAPSDAWIVDLFLIAVAAIVVGNPVSEKGPDDKSYRLMKIIAPTGAMAVMALAMRESSQGLLEWGFFSLLGAATFALSFLHEKIYGKLPFAALALSALLVAMQDSDDGLAMLSVGAIQMALFAAGGFLLQKKSRTPARWAGLMGGSSLLFFLILLLNEHVFDSAHPDKMIWSLASLLLAIMGTLSATWAQMSLPKENPEAQSAIGLHCAAATGFFSLACAILFEGQILTLALAGETLALGWIGTKIAVKDLRKIALCVGSVCLVLFGIQISCFTLNLVASDNRLLTDIMTPAGFGFALRWLALAAAFGGAAFFAHKKEDLTLADGLSAASAAALAAGLYAALRLFFRTTDHFYADTTFLLEKGLVVSLFLGGGAFLASQGSRFALRGVTLAGKAWFFFGLFRLALAILPFDNPYFNRHSIDAAPAFLSLIVTYGLPIPALVFMARKSGKDGDSALRALSRAAALVSGFTLVSLLVRLGFHGDMLGKGLTSNAETYSYSVVWILYGVGLLLSGVMKKERPLYRAGLGMVAFSIAKVFIFDASALHGLFRIASFGGLGLCLLALGWFSTRFAGRFDKE